MLTSVAGAVELSLVPNMESRGDDLDVGLSETAVVSVHLGIGADDGNVSFIDMFFDATPINDPATAGYDVVGRVFRMTRNDGSDWSRVEPWNGRPGIEEFRLIAEDRDHGTDGPFEGLVDSIIIHGTEIGDYDLYFENRFTAEGDPRPPRLRDRDGIELREIRFRNGWRDDDMNIDRPFKVHVVPEPASLALLAVAAVGLVRFRRGG